MVYFISGWIVQGCTADKMVTSSECAFFSLGLHPAILECLLLLSAILFISILFATSQVIVINAFGFFAVISIEGCMVQMRNCSRAAALPHNSTKILSASLTTAAQSSASTVPTVSSDVLSQAFSQALGESLQSVDFGHLSGQLASYNSAIFNDWGRAPSIFRFTECASFIGVIYNRYRIFSIKRWAPIKRRSRLNAGSKLLRFK